MTQKRGLGRGLGALIPGAGSPSSRTAEAPTPPRAAGTGTEEQAPARSEDRDASSSAPGPVTSQVPHTDEPLRTRDHPRTRPEPGEAGSTTRPVDMFFTGTPVPGSGGSAPRGRSGRDLADSMARDVAERRAAQTTGRRRSASRSVKSDKPVDATADASATTTGAAAGTDDAPVAPSPKRARARKSSGTAARAATTEPKPTEVEQPSADQGTGGTDGRAVEVEAVRPEPAHRDETALPAPAAASDVDAVVDVPEPVVEVDVEVEAEDAGGLLPVPGAEFAEIPIHEIRENPRNPRMVFDDDALDELAYSLREVGVLQPVVVRPIPATDDGESFELVMGERRWRAARRAGLASIPAIIRETSDDDLLRDALLENLHRSQLNPLEEAAAYQQLLEDFGCTQEELADRIGRSRPQITNTLRLMKLPPLVQRRLASGALSAGHSRALLGLDSPALMEELAQRIVAEGLSVRAVERLVARGVEPERARSTPRRSTYDPHVVDLTSRLSNKLEAPVRIDVGKRKGRITLEFTNLEDLERLMDRIGLDPEVESSADTAEGPGSTEE